MSLQEKLVSYIFFLLSHWSLFSFIFWKESSSVGKRRENDEDTGARCANRPLKEQGHLSPPLWPLLWDLNSAVLPQKLVAQEPLNTLHSVPLSLGRWHLLPEPNFPVWWLLCIGHRWHFTFWQLPPCSCPSTFPEFAHTAACRKLKIVEFFKHVWSARPFTTFIGTLV